MVCFFYYLSVYDIRFSLNLQLEGRGKNIEFFQSSISSDGATSLISDLSMINNSVLRAWASDTTRSLRTFHHVGLKGFLRGQPQADPQAGRHQAQGGIGIELCKPERYRPEVALVIPDRSADALPESSGLQTRG